LIEELRREVSKLDKSDGCPAAQVLLREDGRLLLIVGCGGRLCSVCGRAYVRRARKKILKGLGGGKWHQEWTITAPGFCEAGCVSFKEGRMGEERHTSGCRDACEVWNDGASGRFNRLMERVKRFFPGAKFEYIKAGELQERGAIHYHVALLGLPYFPEELRRRLLVESGFGRLDKIKHRPTFQWVCWYLTKYFTKSVGPTSWRRKERVLTNSKDWCEWAAREKSQERFERVRCLADGEARLSVPVVTELDAYVAVSRAGAIRARAAPEVRVVLGFAGRLV
jgi:hypothetical protein